MNKFNAPPATLGGLQAATEDRAWYYAGCENCEFARVGYEGARLPEMDAFRCEESGGRGYKACRMRVPGVALSEMRCGGGGEDIGVRSHHLQLWSVLVFHMWSRVRLGYNLYACGWGAWRYNNGNEEEDDDNGCDGFVLFDAGEFVFAITGFFSSLPFESVNVNFSHS